MNTYVIIAILVFIVCILLILVVLVQNSKGGGLASNFSSSNQFMGVRKTADFLEKTTWTLAIIVLALSLISVFAIPRNADGGKSIDSELSTQAQKEQPVDYTPAPGQEAPAGEQTTTPPAQ